MAIGLRHIGCAVAVSELCVWSCGIGVRCIGLVVVCSFVSDNVDE